MQLAALAVHPSDDHLRRLALQPDAAGEQVTEHAAHCLDCRRSVRLWAALGTELATGQTPCPPGDLLVSLIGSQSSLDASQPIAAHVAGCSVCAWALAGLERAGTPGTARSIAAAKGRLLRGLRALVEFEMPAVVVLAARSATALQLDPANRQALRHYSGQRYSRARTAFEAARKKGKPVPELALYLGACLWNEGRGVQSIALFREAVAARPRNGEYRWYLAQALLHHGRGEEALEQLSRAAALAGPKRRRARAQALTVRERLGPGNDAR